MVSIVGMLLFTAVCPKNASYYGNRAATLMMLCRYREALEDSQQAVRLDDTFVKVCGAPPVTNVLIGGVHSLWD